MKGLRRAASTVSLLAPGASFVAEGRPRQVAVDSAGDVFVADTINSRVVELPHGAVR